MILWVLLEPRLKVEIPSERISRVLLAVDDSLSMTLSSRDEVPSPDTPATLNRFDAVRESLRTLNIGPKLRSRHDLHLYRLGEQAQPEALFPRQIESTPADPLAESLARITPTASETRLGDGLYRMVRDHIDAPLAGIVLVTDGRQSAGGPIDRALEIARQAKVPLFPVGVGSTIPPFNLRVAEIRVPTRAFRGDRVNGTAVVQGKGNQGGSAPVEIFLRETAADGGTTMLEVQDVPLPKDNAPVPISFSFVPEKVGRYEIVCRATPQPGEIRNDDNASRSSIDVVDQKTRVLLWAGGPTREYRFLRNLLFRDPSMELSIFLQSARATSAQEGKETLARFPQTREELFRYDVILAIDPDWQSLDPESAPLVEEWVSRQAGGIVLMAGPVHTPQLARELASPPPSPSTAGTPLETLYPVSLKEVFTSDFEAGRYRDAWKIAFTPEGQRSAFLRLDDDESISRQRWNDFPGFYWCYPATSLKPSATLLASYSDPRASVGSSSPVLMASQFLGAGRVFYLGSGELWRIRAIGENAYDRFWVRLVREMSQARLMRGSSRALLFVDGDRFPAGSSVTVRAQVLGPDYRPISDGVIAVSVRGPDGKPQSVDLLPSPARPGFFESSISIPLPGDYQLQMLVPDSDETIERSIVAEIPEREFAEPTLDEAGLQQMADATGGRYLPLAQIDQLPGLITDRSERVLLEGPPIPLWDNAWVLGAIVLLACAEWLLRKSVHLA
jgi:hypothetical protein